MAVHRAPRVGDIYWLNDCPPLLGEDLKKRPVVIVSSVDAESVIGGILVVAVAEPDVNIGLVRLELLRAAEAFV